jgi:hypothetical protein
MSTKKTAATEEKTTEDKTPEEVAENKEITETKTEEKTEKTETVVYVGPTVPGVAVHNVILNNGITEELKKAIEKEPAFANLIVPVTSLAKTAKDIEGKNGAAYVFYEKAATYKA